jgi:hypothetical protein
MVDILGLATALRAATTIIKIVFVFVRAVQVVAALAIAAAASCHCWQQHRNNLVRKRGANTKRARAKVELQL